MRIYVAGVMLAGTSDCRMKKQVFVESCCFDKAWKEMTNLVYGAVFFTALAEFGALSNLA
jgi:hypothetical protein